MFKFVVLASMLALALGQGYGHGGYGAPRAHGGYGQGAGYGGGHDLAQPTPFEYGYDIAGGDGHSGDFKQTRRESGDGHGNVQGSYGYTDAHGIYRQVDYVADGHGYRAQVRTNEPGTDNQSPADVQLHAEPAQHGYGGGYGGGYGHGGAAYQGGRHGRY